jgi:hypothetical protein
MANPATTAARATQDERIPGLPVLPPGTDPATLSVPVYNPATDKTHQSLLGGPAAVTNAIIGGPKLVQYRDSRLYGVPAGALTLDRLTPATIVPGTMATVNNPADTPMTVTKPPQQYVAMVVASGIVGAVLVPRYLGALFGDVVPIVWQEVEVSTGVAETVSVLFVTDEDAILSPDAKVLFEAGELLWLYDDGVTAPPVAVTVNMREAYGVLADGVTDNAAALLRFREDFKGQGKPAVIAQFEDGVVLTSNIRWIHNIRSLELVGGPNGTDLMVIPLGDSRDYDWFYQRIINGGDPFTINMYPVGDIPAYTGTVRRPPAPKFRTAAKGATSITLFDAADMALFKVGDRVLLFGNDQVGGESFPPGARCWDWKKITDLNASTKTLVFNEGLDWAYDERWHDVLDEYDGVDHRGNSGKPRLVNLDRADYIYPELLEFTRISWKINPAYPVNERKVSATFIPIGDTVIARDGLIEGDMDASLSRKVVLLNMRQISGRGKTDNELDKGLKYFIVIGGSYTDYFSNGTSCTEAAIKGATMLNSVALCPRRYIFGEGMTFTADTAPNRFDPTLTVPPAGNPIELGVLMPATFIKKAGNMAAAAYELFNRHEYTVEIAEGQNIILPADWPTDQLPQSQMEAGRTVLSNPDGSKRMRLESVYQDEQGRYVMVMSGAMPTVGDVLAWSSVSKVIDYGGHTLQGFAVRRAETGLLRASAPDSPAGMTRAKLDLLDFDLSARELTADLRSSFVSFTCHVDTAYSGSEGPLMLYFARSGSYETIAAINLSIAGTRTITASGATGQKTGDVLHPAQFGPDVFHNKVQVSLRGSNGGPGNGGLLNRDPAVLPAIRVIVDSLDVEVVNTTRVPDFIY